MTPMNQAITCPGCKSQLTLPALPAGQTVQCPRCARIFDPSLPNVEPTHTVGAPAPAQVFQVHLGSKDDATADLAEDAPLHDRRLVRGDILRGEWKAYLAMALLAANLLSHGLQMYVNVERAWVLQEREELRFAAVIDHPFGFRGELPPPNREQARLLEALDHREDRWERVNAVAGVIHRSNWTTRAR